ncbi:hypothetical protein DESUT3_03690 [Desulfuromonas versatilis]|uniref:YkgJ family cysteine cluster protein n=1 Tax=Desulfuromonas versatilis TaxID=2802975 RepID=A0ABM8HS73_9BACT|nr:YkgJ family cysteine cluster protein [Desulfuromonas versatilis]BCR03300.1 hypothetical protein DESUT3_03690 [Desulfuromonas versatilis]
MDGLLTEYRGLLEKVDDWFRRSQAKAQGLVHCAAGCSQCCRGLFDISLLEAYLLQAGFSQLAEETRERVLAQSRLRLAQLQAQWPDFSAPYLLNHMPDELWTEMPEGDMTPCPLLGEDGRCLVYQWRPMTCRLHGLPNVDRSGEIFSDQWCTLNFSGSNPLEREELRWDFRAAFEVEIDLFQRFAEGLLARPLRELDTFIPTALLIDFAGTDWQNLKIAPAGGVRA